MLPTYVCAADVYLCDLSMNGMEHQGAGESVVFADVMVAGGFPKVIWRASYQLKVRGSLLPRPGGASVSAV